MNGALQLFHDAKYVRRVRLDPLGELVSPPRNALSRPQPQHGGMERRDEIRDAMGREIAAKTTSVE